MKKLVAIFLMTLMFLQAIPVLHFFSAHKEIFYAYIDEDKTEETKVDKVKKEVKEVFVFLAPPSLIQPGQLSYFRFQQRMLPAPYVNALIQPPDAA